MPLKQNLARNRSRGFTLIEVLVSMIILAVGLLGIAGLQAMGLRNNQSALLRSQATLCAYDMSDRMRTNSQGFSADNYDEPASTAVTNCESTTGCSPSRWLPMTCPLGAPSSAIRCPQAQASYASTARRMMGIPRLSSM